MTDPTDDLLARRARIREDMGGADKVAALHAQGRGTVRDRIERLVDPGSFIEIGTFLRSADPAQREATPGDAKIGGHARIDGRPVTVAGDDVTVKGGTDTRNSHRRTGRLLEQALEYGNPFVYFGEAGGSRIPDILGSESMSQGAGMRDFAERWRRIPLVTAIVGRSFGESSFIAALSDLVIQVRGAVMAVSSPRAIEMATGEAITEEELGGAQVHAERTGQIDLVAENDDDAVRLVREFLSYLPSNCHQRPPRAVEREALAPDPELRRIVPAERRRAYDVRKVLARLVDGGRWLELRPRMGRSVITALARLDGAPIGVVASQPMQQGGALTPEACDKIIRLVCTCDAFGLPLVFLQDAPGFLIGRQVEHNRLLYRAMMLHQALNLARVPRFTVIMRKAYGLALFALSGCGMGSNVLYAWPTAEISFMDPEVAANVVNAPQLRALEGDARRREIERLGQALARDVNPYDAAGVMGVDEVIDPADTRLLLAEALNRMLASPNWPSGPGPLSKWPTCF
ncbi:MAG: acyl-CoA carboxylase subunit beta [Gammaproteobacteria bacterium]